MGRFAELFEEHKLDEDKERSEHSANLHLSGEHPDGNAQKHYIYVRQKGAKKNIEGPFRSKEEAERHPARKWADGVHSV